MVRRWAEDDDLWLRRTAILSQLVLKDRTDLDLLRHVVESNLEGSRFGSEFFIRKAIGWALREHTRVDAPAVRQLGMLGIERLKDVKRPS